MGVTKADYFSPEIQQKALLFKALGHPARIAIVEYLMRVNRCICGDIVGELPLAQPTISQHLKELKQVGIIVGDIEGNSVCYCLNPVVLTEISEYINGVTKGICCKE